jgi:rRNA maturation protein Nop10
MELAVLIPPFGSPYGLKVYTCPKCGRTQDYLIPAHSKAA